jgi:transposase
MSDSAFSCFSTAAKLAISPCHVALISALYGVISFTLPNPVPPNPNKIEALRSFGALNRHPQKVRHPLFAEHDFFDPNDMVQLKYETVRAIEVDGRPIAQAALDYGLSRPTIYGAQENFRQAGIGGLLPQKRGPKKARKLTPEVRFYLEELVASEPDIKGAVLVQRVRRRFGIVLHPRTVEKAVRKKGRQTP